MTAGIDHTVTSGTFSIDHETVPVENNVWIVGDDQECVIIDAPHDATEILRVVAGRRVVAILCTHAHNDHVGAAPELAAAVTAPVLLHPDDGQLWQLTHQLPPDGELRDGELRDGEEIEVAGLTLEVLHTQATRLGRCASTPRISPRCSPGTRSSTAGLALPGAASATVVFC
jgi:glyoxylase-like metal-dependent hydrolase (beta-lactamase superfamily II)